MKQGAGAGRSLEASGRDGVDPRGVVVGKNWKSLMWEGLREWCGRGLGELSVWSQKQNLDEDWVIA